MSILALVEVQFQPEKIEDGKAFILRLMPDTRSYDGCQGVDVFVNQDTPGNLVAVEYWESREHHEKYAQWRTETGVMEGLGSMLAGPPSTRYFDKVDG